MAKGPKKMIVVETEYGTFTRTTARVYTHLVIGRGCSAAHLARQSKEERQRRIADEDRWGVYGWSGRLDLARSVVKQWGSIAAEIKIIDIATGQEVR